MRKLTGRKFIGVGKFTLNGTYDRQITQELTEIIRAFEQITGHLPVNNTEPCPYFQARQLIVMNMQEGKD